MAEIDKIASLLELQKVLRQEQVPSEQYKRYIDLFLDFKARRQGHPLSGQFELTPLCNLNCRMCYVHLQKEQLDYTKVLTTEVWKDLMKQAVDAGMMYADLTGGECLTYPGFDELYLYLRSQGVDVSVKTNGILLDEKRIKFFKQKPPSMIQISLYGSSEEAYMRVTGKAIFKRVTDNIRMAKEAGLPITIAITPSRFMTDIKEIVKWANEEGINYIINAGIFDPREETGRSGKELDISIDDYISVYQYSQKLKGIDLVSVDRREVEDHPVDREETNIGIRCAAGRSAFNMDWKGRMYACLNLKAIVSEPIKKGFLQSWAEINETAKQYILPMECQSCKDYDHCIKCVATHQNAPKGHVNPAICERTRRMCEAGLC